jgi:hypothetical protein
MLTKCFTHRILSIVLIIIIMGNNITCTINCNHKIATLRTLEVVPTQPAVQALSPCFALCGTRRLISLPCTPQATGPYPVSLEYFNIIFPSTLHPPSPKWPPLQALFSLTKAKTQYIIYFINKPTWHSFKQSHLFFTAISLYMFRVLSAPIIRSTIKTVDTVIGTLHMSMWCGLNPLKGVQGRESIEWNVPMTVSTVLIVLLMMGAERTRNM